MSSSSTGGCHDDGLAGDPVGNDRLHPVVYPDCAAGRVAAVLLIVGALARAPVLLRVTRE